MTGQPRYQQNGAGPSSGGNRSAEADRPIFSPSSAWVLACLLLFLACPYAFSQSEGNAEYPLKLAFLFNFTKFIEWPADAFPSADAPMEICVVGQDPFGDDLEQSLRRRTVDNRPMAIRRSRPGDDLKGCQIVFVTAEANGQAASIVSRLKNSSVLTVGETKGFAANGGVVNFIVEENKLRFEINLDAAKLTGLSLSSKLLALAKIVRNSESVRLVRQE
jgi:hypothetical protein